VRTLIDTRSDLVPAKNTWIDILRQVLKEYREGDVQNKYCTASTFRPPSCRMSAAYAHARETSSACQDQGEKVRQGKGRREFLFQTLQASTRAHVPCSCNSVTPLSPPHQSILQPHRSHFPLSLLSHFQNKLKGDCRPHCTTWHSKT